MDLFLLVLLHVLSLSFHVSSILALPDRKSSSLVAKDVVSLQEGHAVASNYSLAKRQTDANSVPDYTCGPDRPCKNGACCGKSNVCGYGPVYCESGCQSNCDAHAECGQYAKSPGQSCPLKVCCSQFGFCGTTDDFCGSGCQSNCGQPSKPGKGNDVRNKVIGYWESWRIDAGCGGMDPDQIPVEGLDQINLAFMYIDPNGVELMPMDGMGPGIKHYYQKLADLKSRKPKLQVWVSVGGWSFNDKGPYQKTFSQIAASTVLSREFARACIRFMNEYGFDGIDIDWEYPGAPDRGGTLADISNFPKMLRIMNQIFKTEGGKKFGLSITAPTSYWYLRWFDLNNIPDAVDSINLMSYDLHGIWDSTDPIGPYVYGHTNLTEIDLALDLFWRNNVNPAKVNLGLAFYGRTFQLSDASCDIPGCVFAGPGAPGECTQTAGILSYSEIRTLLSRDKLTDVAHYDKSAACYYVTYGSGGRNWVSFDDGISFQAKVDLANARGLGGLFIWAIDQDNPGFNALQAVIGHEVDKPVPDSETYGAFNLNDCYITQCDTECRAGDTAMTYLNQDASGRGCKGKYHNQRTFCCPPANAPDPKTCRWTGGPVNCHGQCSPGEVSMVLDDWGDSDKRCTNGGKKVWCCPATNGQSAINKCKLIFSGEKQSCPSDLPQTLTSVYSTTSDLDGGRIALTYSLCCPAEPDFKNCAWAGDNYYCNNNQCPLGQVEIIRNHGQHAPPKEYADSCNKGRQQAFCCDPPLTGGSPFLPVPLANLFPAGKSFPSDYDPEFAEAFDDSGEEYLPPLNHPLEPNSRTFAWVIMVGDEEDVQSFDKRDGTYLELFDCPNPSHNDYSMQKVRAICIADAGFEDHDCEHILKGGVEGTVVRLPDHCGPDTWVRAVSWEKSTNRTLPRHIMKRAEPHHEVYDFHYDYNFRNLRRDGGEVYVRIDTSSHPGYWDKIVAGAPGTPKKRDITNWRDLDKRWWSESKPGKDWATQFNNLLDLVDLPTGLTKKYSFNQCLFSASATCGGGTASGSAFAKAGVSGSFETTYDFGTTLIGTLRQFSFSEAYAFFRHESFKAKIQSAIEVEARLRFDSGLRPYDTAFVDLGGVFNLKGILIIENYFEAQGRVQAEVTASVQATAAVDVTHNGFSWMAPPVLDALPDQGNDHFNTHGQQNHPIAFARVDTGVSGNMIISNMYTFGLNISLAFGGKQYVDSSVRLTTQLDNSYGIGVPPGSHCGGTWVNVSVGAQANMGIDSALSGWTKGPYHFLPPKQSVLGEFCIPFSSSSKGKRELEGGEGNSSMPMNSNLLLPRAPGDPGDTDGVCLFEADGVFCGRAGDDDDASCDFYANIFDDGSSYFDNGGEVDDDSGIARRDLSPDKGSLDDLLSRFLAERFNGSASMVEHLLERRGNRNKQYCEPRPTKKDGVTPIDAPTGAYDVQDYLGVDANSGIEVAYPPYWSTGQVIKKYPNNLAYAFENPTDCNNYNLKTYKSSEVNGLSGTRKFDAEHVLEQQTYTNFMNHQVQAWGDLKSIKAPAGYVPNPKHMTYTDPTQIPNKRPEKPKLEFCTYMKRWWDLASIGANQKAVLAYPSTKNYQTELILLEQKLNGVYKASWFTGRGLQCSNQKKIQGLFDSSKWSELLTCIKGHVVTYKYYSTPANKALLVKQARRLWQNIGKLDDETIPDDTTNPYPQDYIKLGLADAFKDFVVQSHLVASASVINLVQDLAQRMVDATKDNKNAKIKANMAAAQAAAKSLQPWVIAWDWS